MRLPRRNRNRKRLYATVGTLVAAVGLLLLGVTSWSVRDGFLGSADALPPVPVLNVDTYVYEVFGNNFEATTSVDIYLDEVLVETERTDGLTTDGFGSFSVDFDLGEVDLSPDVEVEVIVGATSRTYVITAVVLTDIDATTDTVTGTAAPGSYVEIALIANDILVGSRNVEADAMDGTWTADFRVPPESSFDIVVDLEPGVQNLNVGVTARQCDGDDCTFQTGNPLIFTMDLSTGEVGGKFWPVGSSITLTIDDPDTPQPVDYADTGVGSATEFEDFVDIASPADNGFRILPGFVVTMTDGIRTKSLIVPDLSVTEVNSDLDYVEGTAEHVDVVLVAAGDPYDPGAQETRIVPVDASGNWRADFSVAGTGEITVDIDIGSFGGVFSADLDDADATFVCWEALDNPRVTASITNDFIFLQGFAECSSVTFELYDSEGGELLWSDTTMTTFVERNVEGGHGVDLRGGMFLSASQSFASKDLELATGLSITTFDTGTETLAGQAPIGIETVRPFVFGDVDFCGVEAAVIEGEWEANFAGEPCFLDLTDDSEGGVSVADDDGDRTFVQLVGVYRLCLGVVSDLQATVDAMPGPVADKLDDAVQSMASACMDFAVEPPNNQGALNNLEGAVGDLEAAVAAGLLAAGDGAAVMDEIAGIARAVAAEAISVAIDVGGDTVKIAEAETSFAGGDTLRAVEAFKDAVAQYKDAVAKAEGA